MGVRVEDNFGWIEPVPVDWAPGAVDTVSVQLTRSDVRQVRVPDHVRAIDEGDADHLDACVRRVEQAKLDLGGILREECEIDARSIPARAQGIWQSRPCPHQTAILSTQVRRAWRPAAMTGDLPHATGRARVGSTLLLLKKW